MSRSRGEEREKFLIIMKNLLTKIQILHEMNFAHMKLIPNNIYFNYVTNEVFFGPIKLSHVEENELWYSSPESTFLSLQSQNNEESSHINLNSKIFDIMKSPQNDIWSIGCILMEMFFVSTPLLQSFSIRDKIRKMIEILGLPMYEDVSNYVNAKEYNLIAKIYHNKNNEPIIYDLMDYNKKTANPYMQELYGIILDCLSFNPEKRPSVSNLISRFRNLDDLSFSYKTKLYTEPEPFQLRSRYNSDKKVKDYSSSRSSDKKESSRIPNLPYSTQNQVNNKNKLQVKNDEDYNELNTSKIKINN
jgi:serine/threonine protein kinase